jgi:hypothetical protein
LSIDPNSSNPKNEDALGALLEEAVNNKQYFQPKSQVTLEKLKKSLDYAVEKQRNVHSWADLTSLDDISKLRAVLSEANLDSDTQKKNFLKITAALEGIASEFKQVSHNFWSLFPHYTSRTTAAVNILPENG